MRDSADRESLSLQMTPNVGIFHIPPLPYTHTKTQKATPYGNHQTCEGRGGGLCLGGRWSLHLSPWFQGTQVTTKAPGGAERKVVYLTWG